MRKIVMLLGLLLGSHAIGDEISPGILRTPDDRFAGLEEFPFAPNYMQVGEVRLHYLDEGPANAEETILLIHGEPTWSYLFRRMIPVFVDAGYRVIAPDMVGFGKSDKYADENAYSYVMQVDHMTELVQKLNLSDMTLFLVRTGVVWWDYG